MQVPCGRCYACRVNKRTEWTVRNLLELQCAKWSTFVTLTYDDEHIPMSASRNFFEVCKSDVQAFFKRLRKFMNSTNIGNFRYFLTAEYGEGLRRPHYHALLYFDDYASHSLQFYDTVQAKWGNGLVSFGDVEAASIHYCMKYIMKFDETCDPLPEEVAPVFRLMSRKPAIGLVWLDERKRNYYEQCIIRGDPCLVNVNGRDLNLPRFFVRKVLQLPWDIARSQKFHEQVILQDSQSEQQEYSQYLRDNGVLEFQSWQVDNPKYLRHKKLDTFYKQAYTKHLREHLIN